ncbi:exonuclease subunit SbcD [Shewanella gaetbuli]|uniref:Nuclease SbcCD subunit D n=1 Tax=Shewanella gaetbuli TaxID=220752 RepID=A0A9X1ZPY6_9GAMM|nr:exonuclease subunit SbcD [Shewanella gaetbuli]MCL1143425.1 exonuclease subunit SbcD [Shewanella gaetbuli]
MRIIHTSDWHLGQHFLGKSRAAEHAAFMQWLLEQIQRYHVDALIVAGDIFDTGTPPSYARSLYNQFMVDIQKTSCQMIVLGGNHDSVATLGESQQLLKFLNVTVVPGVAEALAEHVVVIETNNQPSAIVCALPYMRPRDLVLSQADESSHDKQHKLANEIAQKYQQCFALAQQKNAQYEHRLPIIATGHLTTVGASTSESVRDIYIGSLDAFNANLFPQADYIALGHIHRPQKIAKTEHIRYSGSPIPLSFDELNGQKSVYLVEFDQAKLVQVDALPVPRFQAMASLKGNLAEIESQLAQFALADVSDEPQQTTWLSIEVAQQEYLSDLQNKISELTQGLPVEILQLKRRRKTYNPSATQQENETLSELSVEEVFQRRLAKEDFSGEDLQHKKQRINQLFVQVVDKVNQQLMATEDKQ